MELLRDAITFCENPGLFFPSVAPSDDLRWTLLTRKKIVDRLSSRTPAPRWSSFLGYQPHPWSCRQAAPFCQFGMDSGPGLHSSGATTLVPALEELPARHLWLLPVRSHPPSLAQLWEEPISALVPAREEPIVERPPGWGRLLEPTLGPTQARVSASLKPILRLQLGRSCPPRRSCFAIHDSSPRGVSHEEPPVRDQEVPFSLLEPLHDERWSLDPPWRHTKNHTS
ncbi:hypothetical protein NDU88_002040 [Pleurodeles waltl]|uniref:Uncharacterized protein n=1 Tax=Pleurodeles waltl TaxID=8319 RepID=A0AAV7VBD4_PLEWA|nr:hypothetical protein NDU88_002040 [Pleurodeles waltl]